MFELLKKRVGVLSILIAVDRNLTRRMFQQADSSSGNCHDDGMRSSLCEHRKTHRNKQTMSEHFEVSCIFREIILSITYGFCAISKLGKYGKVDMKFLFFLSFIAGRAGNRKVLVLMGIRTLHSELAGNICFDKAIRLIEILLYSRWGAHYSSFWGWLMNDLKINPSGDRLQGIVMLYIICGPLRHCWKTLVFLDTASYSPLNAILKTSGKNANERNNQDERNLGDLAARSKKKKENKGPWFDFLHSAGTGDPL